MSASLPPGETPREAETAPRSSGKATRQRLAVAGAIALVLGGAAWAAQPKPKRVAWGDGTMVEQWEPGWDDRLRDAWSEFKEAHTAQPEPVREAKVGCPLLRGPDPRELPAEQRPRAAAFARWVAADARELLTQLRGQELTGWTERRDELRAFELHLEMCLSQDDAASHEYFTYRVQDRFFALYPGSVWEAGLREDLGRFPRRLLVDPQLSSALPDLALGPAPRPRALPAPSAPPGPRRTLCTVGRALPPPPPSSANAEALKDLRAAHATLQKATLEETDEVLQTLYNDQKYLPHDELDEPREAYLIAGLRCKEAMVVREPAAPYHQEVQRRGHALIATYPQGVYSAAIGQLLPLDP